MKQKKMRTREEIQKKIDFHKKQLEIVFPQCTDEIDLAFIQELELMTKIDVLQWVLDGEEEEEKERPEKVEQIEWSYEESMTDDIKSAEWRVLKIGEKLNDLISYVNSREE